MNKIIQTFQELDIYLWWLHQFSKKLPREKIFEEISRITTFIQSIHFESNNPKFGFEFITPSLMWTENEVTTLKKIFLSELENLRSNL